MDNKNSSDQGGIPKWANWGLGALIAAYLLGMIPGISSPFDKLRDGLTAMGQTIAIHDETAKAQVRVQRMTCKGVWKGNPEMQAQCDW